MPQISDIDDNLNVFYMQNPLERPYSETSIRNCEINKNINMNYEISTTQCDNNPGEGLVTCQSKQKAFQHGYKNIFWENIHNYNTISMLFTPMFKNEERDMSDIAIAVFLFVSEQIKVPATPILFYMFLAGNRLVRIE